MNETNTRVCSAFDGDSLIASGELAHVAEKAKQVLDRNDKAAILIFDDSTGEVIEVDFRGTADDVLQRLRKNDPSPEQESPAPRGPGRPKLGVVAREVTLLPRHWDWLNSQPGGASVALRKLVEEARRVNGDRDQIRRSQESAYRFMSAMAGNQPGFEEATRALFAGDRENFEQHIASWPTDVRNHARKLAEVALQRPARKVGNP